MSDKGGRRACRTYDRWHCGSIDDRLRGPCPARSIDPFGPTPSGYVTYFILDRQTSGNPAMDRQLDSDIVMALAEKDLAETAPQDAEAVVVVHTASAARHSREVSASERCAGARSGRPRPMASRSGTSCLGTSRIPPPGRLFHRLE